GKGCDYWGDVGRRRIPTGYGNIIGALQDLRAPGRVFGAPRFAARTSSPFRNLSPAGNARCGGYHTHACQRHLVSEQVLLLRAALGIPARERLSRITFWATAALQPVPLVCRRLPARGVGGRPLHGHPI